jgi:hypothetical protein
VPRNTPLTLTAMMRSQSSSLISSTHDSAMYAVGLLGSSTVPGAESAKQDRGCTNGTVDLDTPASRPLASRGRSGDERRIL